MKKIFVGSMAVICFLMGLVMIMGMTNYNSYKVENFISLFYCCAVTIVLGRMPEEHFKRFKNLFMYRVPQWISILGLAVSAVGFIYLTASVLWEVESFSWLLYCLIIGVGLIFFSIALEYLIFTYNFNKTQNRF